MKEKSLANAVRLWLDNVPYEKIGSLTVSGLAGKFRVSPSYLSRCFHKYSYTTLQEYLELSRLFAFRRVVRSMENPQVKKALKFMNIQNTSQFIRRYKKWYNRTPGQFCRQERETNKIMGRKYYELKDL